MQRLTQTVSLGLMIVAFAVGTTPVRAGDGDLHPIDSTLEVLGLKTTAGPMPDFVEQSRGARTADEYLPVGASPPKRALKPKSAADVKALTAELDAARDAQAAGRRPKPMSDGAPVPKAAAGAGKPKGLKGAAPTDR